MADTNNGAFSANDLNAVVDVFKDTEDAPKHPDDTFDPNAYLDFLLDQDGDDK